MMSHTESFFVLDFKKRDQIFKLGALKAAGVKNAF